MLLPPSSDSLPHCRLLPRTGSGLDYYQGSTTVTAYSVGFRIWSSASWMESCELPPGSSYSSHAVVASPHWCVNDFTGWTCRLEYGSNFAFSWESACMTVSRPTSVEWLRQYPWFRLDRTYVPRPLVSCWSLDFPALHLALVRSRSLLLGRGTPFHLLSNVMTLLFWLSERNLRPSCSMPAFKLFVFFFTTCLIELSASPCSGTFLEST